MQDEKKNIYVTVHKNFVREDIEYVDRVSGETRAFNQVTLPKGTVINGQDVSYFQFSPLFVNPSRYKGEDFRDIPLLAHKEVWLKRSVIDAEGNPILDEDGRQTKDVIKVMPSEIKAAVDEGRRQYLESLGDRAKGARESADAYEHSASGRASMAREDIAF